MNEKHTLGEEKIFDSTNTSPVPEIRITFPEEDGKNGQGGRVVSVRVSEMGSIGLEPYDAEPLPVYERTEQGFQNLDLERMGGLKEHSSEKLWA